MFNINSVNNISTLINEKKPLQNKKPKYSFLKSYNNSNFDLYFYSLSQLGISHQISRWNKFFNHNININPQFLFFPMYTSKLLSIFPRITNLNYANIWKLQRYIIQKSNKILKVGIQSQKTMEIPKKNYL